MIKRYELYKGDFVKAHEDYLDYIDHVKHYTDVIDRGFAYWLMDEVEVIDGQVIIIKDGFDIRK